MTVYTGTGVQITVTGLEQAAASLRQLAALPSGAREALASIGAELQANIADRMDRQVDPSGVSWVPLAESTRRRRRGGVQAQHHILRDTGIMAGSLHSVATDDEVRVGFGVRYAMYHEWGSLNVDGRPPRRGLLTADPDTGELSEEDKASVREMVAFWVRRRLGR